MKAKFKRGSRILQLTANNNKDRATLNSLFRKGVWTQRLALDSRELDLYPIPSIEDCLALGGSDANS